MFRLRLFASLKGDSNARFSQSGVCFYYRIIIAFIPYNYWEPFYFWVWKALQEIRDLSSKSAHFFGSLTKSESVILSGYFTTCTGICCLQPKYFYATNHSVDLCNFLNRVYYRSAISKQNNNNNNKSHRIRDWECLLGALHGCEWIEMMPSQAVLYRVCYGQEQSIGIVSFYFDNFLFDFYAF